MRCARDEEAKQADETRPNSSKHMLSPETTKEEPRDDERGTAPQPDAVLEVSGSYISGFRTSVKLRFWASAADRPWDRLHSKEAWRIPILSLVFLAP